MRRMPKLDPTSDEFRAAGHKLIDWIGDYLDGVDRYDVLSHVQPGDITDVVFTHLHFDHVGWASHEGAIVFPNATYRCDGRDWEHFCDNERTMSTLAPIEDRLTTWDGSGPLAPGVDLMSAPGHTPGTLSYTFTVRDRGRPVNIVYSGGTAFNFVNNKPDPGIKNFEIYIESAQHMAERAAVAHATVLLSNHSEFDSAVNKNKMIAGRGDGPNPYEIGADMVQRYFQVMQGCARAAQIGLEQKQAEHR